MSWYGPIGSDVLFRVLLDQGPANVRVELVVEWAHLSPEAVKIAEKIGIRVVECRLHIVGTPGSPGIRVTWEKDNLKFRQKEFGILISLSDADSQGHSYGVAARQTISLTKNSLQIVPHRQQSR